MNTYKQRRINKVRRCRKGHNILGDNAFKTKDNGTRCLRCLQRLKRESSDRVYFGGNRFRAIERDGGACVSCGMTQKQHKETHGNDITVDHIDGDRSNNSLDNLQTLCLSCHGTKDVARRKYTLTKLTENQVINIFHCRNKPNERAFPSQSYLAKLYGVGQPTIYRIQRQIRCSSLTRAGSRND